MSGGFTPRRNSFHMTMLGLEYPPDLVADLFSRACVDSFASAEFGRFGYVFTQVFEPAVLAEVALLEGVSYASLAEMDHRSTPTMRRLAQLVRDSASLSVVELVNLASVLISVSRFDVAARLLAAAVRRAGNPRERFEIAWLEFLNSNRREDGARSPAAFATMRAQIDTGKIPRGRVLDTCTQAVVWYLKRREVSDDDFAWAVKTGRRLVAGGGDLDAGSVSSWFRGIAMLPAAHRAAGTTRRLMHRAREAAEEKLAEDSSAVQQNLIKTYYESALKEQLYVARDFTAAIGAGRDLIALDPVWAPSYAELAEVYERLGDPRSAAELYEQAASVGPPYVGHHLAAAARCRAGVGEAETAVQHYTSLLELAPGNEAVLGAGRALVGQVSTATGARFERAAALAGGTS